MSDKAPDPYLAETAFDADEWTAESADEIDGEEDELEIEEDRAREG